MKKLTIIFLLAITSSAFSQDWPLKNIVAEKKQAGLSFINTPGFHLTAQKTLGKKGIYQVLQIDTAFSRQLLAEKPAAVQVSIPVSNTETIVCDMVKFSLGNVVFTQNNKETLEGIQVPVLYQGVVAGETRKNSVVLTVNDSYLSVLINLPDRTLQVTKSDETEKSAYRLYNSQQLQFPTAIPDCGTRAVNTPAAAARVADIDPTGNLVDSLAHRFKCVSVFVDCLDSLYIARGSSMQSTIDFVYELFAATTTGYANEQIMIQLSNVNVWTVPDPFAVPTREKAVVSVCNYYQDNYFGNVGLALDFSKNGRGGIASVIGGAKGFMPNTCPYYHDSLGTFAYDDLNYTVNTQNFPVGPNTTGPQIYSAMHELGHLLNAHHTKWCGWQLTANPLTFGTLDSCGVIEGNCAQGPPPPPTGATIMSYCVFSKAGSADSANQFVNYLNGFGLLPGNAIRNFVGQNNCIAKCVQCIVSNQRNRHGEDAYVSNGSPLDAEQPRANLLLVPFPKTKK